MKEHITGSRIANAIAQDNSFKGTYILVEGNNDYTLYRKFCNNELCQVQIAHGKQNIVEALQILEARGYKNSLGIIDSDFRNLEEIVEEENLQNLFFTDHHDIETTIIQSDALDTVVDYYCEKEKLDKFRAENDNRDIRIILMNLLAPLGYLKWANSKEGWGLLFKSKNVEGPELKIEDFIPVAKMAFEGNQSMTKTVFNYSRGKVKVNVTEKDVLNHLDDLCNVEVENSQLCNGHDLAYLFALSIRKKLSNYNSKAVPAEQIEKDLILSYDSRHFEQTNLYAKLKQFEVDRALSILKI